MKKELTQLINSYLLDAQLQGHTEQGLIGLRNRVPKFFRFLEEKDLKINEIGIKEAAGYQGWLLETGRKDGKPYSPRTINAYIVAVTGFYEYLVRLGISASNPFKEIRKVRTPKTLPPPILKEKEITRLLDTLADFNQEKDLKRRISRYRMHVATELMYATGLRISEVAQLKVEDLDFDRGIIRVREGKGRESRRAYLNDYAKEVVKLYVKEMRELIFNEWNQRRGTLFGLGWQSFDKKVNAWLKKAARESGYDHITSHGLRHALGYHLLRAGCNIRYIQEILGHKLLRNTEIYTKVDKEDLKDVLDSFHPRQFKRNADEKDQP